MGKAVSELHNEERKQAPQCPEWVGLVIPPQMVRTKCRTGTHLPLSVSQRVLHRAPNEGPAGSCVLPREGGPHMGKAWHCVTFFGKGKHQEESRMT